MLYLIMWDGGYDGTTMAMKRTRDAAEQTFAAWIAQAVEDGHYEDNKIVLHTVDDERPDITIREDRRWLGNEHTPETTDDDGGVIGRGAGAGTGVGGATGGEEQWKTVFYNVNEEGEPYDRHDSLDAALAVLRQFPNDSVVVTTSGSPMDLALAGDTDTDPDSATSTDATTSPAEET